MADKPASIRVAQAITVFLTAAEAGASLGLSFFVIPRLLESPVPLMLRQWFNSLSLTKRVFPALGNITALGYFYLAYRFSGSAPARLYGVAGALSLGIVPYTLAFVMPTNRKLFKKVEETRIMGDADVVVETSRREETAKYLVDHWGMLNLGRAAMVVAAGAIGLWASL